MNAILNEVEIFTSHLKRIALVFLPLYILVMIFNPLTFQFGMTTSFSVYIFKMISHSLGIIKIIAISPFEALITDMKIGAMISLMIISPYIAYEMISFAVPGLSKRERKLTKLSLIPATVLFILGTFFAWYLIIPFLFSFTGKLDVAMGIIPTVSANSFVVAILSIIFAMGFSFELPVIISGLAFLGVVKTEQLTKNWRYAVIGSFGIALLISPGATGGIMETFIGLTLSGLYGVGVLSSKMIETRRMNYVASA